MTSIIPKYRIVDSNKFTGPEDLSRQGVILSSAQTVEEARIWISSQISQGKGRPFLIVTNEGEPVEIPED